MTVTKYVIGLLVALIVGFAIGKHTQPSTSTDAKSAIEQDKDTHTQTKTITVKEPDGKVETITTIDTVIAVKTTETKDTQTTIAPQKSKINISAMAGYDVFPPSAQPVFGISISKELLGHIAIGAFGMTNGVIGVTVGVNF